MKAVVRQMNIRGPEEEPAPDPLKPDPPKGKPKDPNTEIMRRLRIQNKKLLEQVGLLKEQVKLTNTDKHHMAQRLQELIRLSNILSDALGSCHLCWGEDPHCSSCGGNGSPGWKNVHKRRFQIYVMPALKSYME